MSAFTPAPHGPCGKEEQAQACAEVSCSAPRAGLGPPQFSPVALGTLRAGKCTHLVPSSGAGTRKGPRLFYCYCLYYYYGVLEWYMPEWHFTCVGCEWPLTGVWYLWENKKLGILV